MNATKFIRIESQVHKALRIRSAERELTIAFLAGHYIVAGIRAEREARERERFERRPVSRSYVPDTPAVAEAQLRIREAMTDSAAAAAEENLLRVIESERAKIF